MARYSYRYLVRKAGTGGTSLWYWQPTAGLRAFGWRPQRLCRDATFHGKEPPEPVLAAWRALDAQLRAWEAGTAETTPQEASAAQQRTLAAGIAHYKAESLRWKRLKPKTKKDYGWCLRTIEAWGGDVPARRITRKRVQQFYRDLYAASPAKANATIRVLRIVLKFLWNEGWIDSNAAEKPELMELAPRVRIFADAETDAVVAAAEILGLPSIGAAHLLGVYLGQREGDILGLLKVQRQRGQDGLRRIHLRQSKRLARVAPREHPRLTAALDALEQRNAARWPEAKHLLVCELTGRPWNSDTFRHKYAEVRALAAEPQKFHNLYPAAADLVPCPSVADAWFMDTRDTAVTKLAVASGTIPEICSITGHSEKSAVSVLKHYLALTGDMADSAIQKLIDWEEAQERTDQEKQR